MRVSPVLERCSGICKVSNAWTNAQNEMMKEKIGVKKLNSKEGFEKNEHEGVFVPLDSTASQYLKLACPTWTIKASLSSDIS